MYLEGETPIFCRIVGVPIHFGQVNLVVYDIHSQPSARKNLYEKKLYCIIACFSVIDPESFKNVKKIWFLEINFAVQEIFQMAAEVAVTVPLPNPPKRK